MIKLLRKVIQINKPQPFSFSVGEAGWYLILVSARVKSEQQVSQDSTDDQDLTVKIDNLTFPQLTDPNRLIDSPAAFSGGKLHNRKKTIYFILFLHSGDHKLTLTPDQEAEAIDVSHEKLNLQNKKLTLSLNQQAEDGERRPFITFALVYLPLTSFTLTAITHKRYRDSDDLKIIVDGEVKTQFKDTKERPTHPLPLQWFYRFWYFVGSILLGKSTSAHFKTALSKGLHYLELWADRKPILGSIEFNFEEPSQEPVRIQKYKGDRFGRDYNQLDEYILGAVSFWNDFFLKQEYPPPESLDPNLAKAIIYRESRLGYYPSEKIVDVMQVWNEEDPAKPTLLGEKPESEFVNPNEVAFIHYTYPKDRMPPKVENREESIFWGVRWLYHKAQYLPNLKKPYVRKWLTWKEAVWNYNANPEIVKEYVREVFLVYEEGVDLDGNVLWEK